MQSRLIQQLELLAPLSGPPPSMSDLARRQSPQGWWRFAASSSLAAMLLLILVWHVCLRMFSAPEPEIPSSLGLVEPALWSCLFIALSLLALYAMHRPKALRFNEQGLFISTRTVDGCSLEKYVAWRWLTEATLVDYGFVVKEPRLQFRTKWGGTCSISLKQASASLSEDVLLSALRKWAPNVVSQVENYFSRERRPGNRELRYTELWFQSLHQSSNQVSKRKFLGELLPAMTLRNRRYEVVERLGRGGQATAYLVVDRTSALPGSAGVSPASIPGSVGVPPAPRSGSAGVSPASSAQQKLVLKEYIFPASEDDCHLIEVQLQAELDLLRSLSHHAIVNALDIFIEDYRGYMVLEYVEGETLKHLVEKGGSLAEHEVILVALQVIGAIGHAHNMIPPVVHCDLTPDNLIRQANGKLKVVDFNSATTSGRQASHLHRDGQMIVGKQSYMPPEQFKGNYNVQSDIYALGATLFFLLTGEEPEPLSVSRPANSKRQISAELDDVVARATALDPQTRYESMASMRDDLKRILLHSKIKNCRRSYSSSMGVAPRHSKHD